MGLGLAYPMEKVDTILEKRKGHIELSKDKYYLHALDTSRDYKAHLVAKNERDIVIDQQLFVV
jgi:hypothetical protein